MTDRDTEHQREGADDAFGPVREGVPAPSEYARHDRDRSRVAQHDEPTPSPGDERARPAATSTAHPGQGRRATRGGPHDGGSS